MRYLKYTLLLLLLPSVCFGFGVVTVGSLGSGVVAGAPVAPTADYEWSLLDNAANTTLLPTSGGISGRAPVNTSTLATGSGLNLPTSGKIYVSDGGIAVAVLEGGDFTMQGTFTSEAADPPGGSSTYLWSTSTLDFDLRLNFGAADNITLYANGSSRGNATTGYNLDDDSPHVVRIIYNSIAQTAALYIGATEGSLALRHTWTSVPAPATVGTYLNMADRWNGIIRDWKIWTSVQVP